MDTLLDFFSSIGEIIVSIVKFVISFFQDLIYVIKLTGKVVGQIPAFFSWMPAEIISLLVILFGVVVIYKILGREG